MEQGAGRAAAECGGSGMGDLQAPGHYCPHLSVVRSPGRRETRMRTFMDLGVGRAHEGGISLSRYGPSLQGVSSS